MESCARGSASRSPPGCCFAARGDQIVSAASPGEYHSAAPTRDHRRRNIRRWLRSGACGSPGIELLGDENWRVVVFDPCVASHVRARGESALAGTLQDGDSQFGVGVEAQQIFAELTIGLEIERVEALGPIELDLGDRTAGLVKDLRRGDSRPRAVLRVACARPGRDDIARPGANNFAALEPRSPRRRSINGSAPIEVQRRRPLSRST